MCLVLEKDMCFPEISGLERIFETGVFLEIEDFLGIFGTRQVFEKSRGN